MEILNSFNQALVELHELGCIKRLMQYDESVFLPASARPARGEQIAYLQRCIHRQLCNPDFVAIVEKLSSIKEDLTLKDRINVSKIQRKQIRALAIDESLQSAISRQQSRTIASWIEARANDSFQFVLPEFARLCDLIRTRAEKLPGESSHYEALMRDYEPDLSLANVSAELSKAESCIRALESENKVRASTTASVAQIDLATQKQLCAWIFQGLGLDDTIARLDQSPHPFSSSLAQNDLRITTRYSIEDPFESIYSTIHECGHALYSKMLPPNWWKTPVGQPHSYLVDEAHARFWENCVGRSDIFLDILCKELQNHLTSSIDKHALYRQLRSLKHTDIRTQSDELSYFKHIGLRFTLEQKLIDGQLRPDEMPDVWNEEFKLRFGRYPNTQADGVLQDIHWYSGAFGYFPSYAQGTILAICLYQDFTQEVSLAANPGIKDIGEKAYSFLQQKIGQYGSSLSTTELLSASTTCWDQRFTHLSKYLKERYCESALQSSKG